MKTPCTTGQSGENSDTQPATKVRDKAQATLRSIGRGSARYKASIENETVNHAERINGPAQTTRRKNRRVQTEEMSA